jgi:hypothetical protein
LTKFPATANLALYEIGSKNSHDIALETPVHELRELEARLMQGGGADKIQPISTSSRRANGADEKRQFG